MFTLTSAFPSLSIHFDIFFSSSGSNITAFFCITLNGLFAFLEKCVKDKIKVDNLYVISDMQIGDGESIVWEKSSNYEYGKFAELLKGFKKVNPNCKIVSISIQGYGSEMFYRGSNILNIAGWSESIFDVINSKFCGYKNMIEEIKKIKI